MNDQPCPDNELDRLAAAMRCARAPRSLVEMGGRVVETGAGFIRAAGLGSSVAPGDRLVSATNPRYQAEIIHVGAGAALARVYDAGSPLPLGAHVYRAAPLQIAPCELWRGRVLNALAEPIDEAGVLQHGAEPRMLSAHPPPAMLRQRVATPLRTGVRAIDIFTPLCVGQRIGVFAGSGVGKSTLLGMLTKSAVFDEIVVGLIGERGREVREFIEDSLGESRRRAVVVAATGDETAMMRRLAAFSAVATAESFRDRGKRVLLILDSVTRFAQASREIAISAGEPAVSRGFPPSVFSDLPRLLERAGPGVEGTGSITGIFSVLIEGDDHNDPIADCIRGTLDGHIVLDRSIADQGRYPAINLLSSLSRLADCAWTAEQRVLVRDMRRMIARYEDTRDIRSLGGYRPGVDVDLDASVALAPRIYEALTQSQPDQAAYDPFALLSDAMRNGSPPP